MGESRGYSPDEYWQTLLRRQFDLRGAGYPYLSGAFNVCLYRAMADSIDRGLRRLCFSQDALRQSSVLDVGSGTGFWIEFWLAKGAQQITGIDLTAESVFHLAQKYPQLEFQQRDVADPIDSGTLKDFDVISAMSVLHHIPSQQRWEQALVNLGRMLKPGGYLLIMDPILRYRWWGKPFDRSSKGYPRTIAEHVSMLEQTGVTLQLMLPTVAILANPVDTKWKLEFRLLEQWWSLFYRVAFRERLMRSSCWLVYALDRLLCRLNYMPSSKVMFCRKGTSS